MDINRWLACCGALVTILSLAFSFFIQQLLTFELFPTYNVALQPGNVPRSEIWKGWTGDPSERRQYPPIYFMDLTNEYCSRHSTHDESRRLQWNFDWRRPNSRAILPDRQLYMAQHTFFGHLRCM